MSELASNLLFAAALWLALFLYARACDRRNPVPPARRRPVPPRNRYGVARSYRNANCRDTRNRKG